MPKTDAAKVAEYKSGIISARIRKLQKGEHLEFSSVDLCEAFPGGKEGFYGLTEIAKIVAENEDMRLIIRTAYAALIVRRLP